MTGELERVKGELVAANRILAREGILDAYGHVSARHPDRPDRFLLSRARSPENVELDDVLTFSLDGVLVEETEAIPYAERFIHAACYEARPEVSAVCHHHALSVLPFSISTTARLRATINASRPYGDGLPVWDIADGFGTDTDLLVRTIEQGRSLATALGEGPVVLMRGHGSAVVAGTLREVVSRCLDLDRSARSQVSVMTLGPERTQTEVELAAHPRLPPGLAADDRAWEYLLHRAGIR